MVHPKNKQTLKGDSLLYHDLLDCDLIPRTNNLRYIGQITHYIIGRASAFPTVCSSIIHCAFLC